MFKKSYFLDMKASFFKGGSTATESSGEQTEWDSRVNFAVETSGV